MKLPDTIPLAPLIDPDHNPERRLRVVVVGAGGIGARVIPTLVKILPTDQRTEVLVIDPDVVEPKNIRRQPFGPEHVGEYKAVVMQDRYSTPALPVTAICEKFSGKTITVGFGSDTPMVILGCVDNTQARSQMLATAIHRNFPSLYLDAGNDGNRGQVILAFAKLRGVRNPATGSRYNVITAVDKFPEVFEPEDPAPAGCDLLDTQTPMANHMAATFLLQYLSLILHGQLLGSCGLTFTTLGSTSPIPLVRFGGGSSYAEWTAATQDTPRGHHGEVSNWLEGWVRAQWNKRKAADAEKAGKTAKPADPVVIPATEAVLDQMRAAAAGQGIATPPLRVEDARVIIGARRQTRPTHTPGDRVVPLTVEQVLAQAFDPDIDI